MRELSISPRDILEEENFKVLSFFLNKEAGTKTSEGTRWVKE